MKAPLLDYKGARAFSRLSAQEKRAFIGKLSDAEALQLQYTWEAWARDKQLPPPGRWTTLVVRAGRGFGKTRCGAEWIRANAEGGKIGRMILVARTAADVRDVMIDGDSGLMAISPPWFKPYYEPTKRRLTWPNGCVATTYSAEEPDALRGPQCLAGHTRVLMADGSQKPIAEICVGEYVMTRIGPRRVTASFLTKKNSKVYLLRSMDGRNIIGTADHLIWVENRGFTPLSMLSKGMPLCVTPVLNGMDTPGIKKHPTKTIMNGAFFSTVPSGNKPMGQFQRDAIFITRMVIKQITDWKIWNSLLEAIICLCTLTGLFPIGTKPKPMHKKRWPGIDRYAYNGHLSVSFAGKSSTVLPPIRPVSAQQSAWKLAVPVPSRERYASVSIAEKSTVRRSGYSAIAHEDVTIMPVNSGHRHLKSEWSSAISAIPFSSHSDPMPVSVPINAPLLSTNTTATVEKLATRYDVYDITVEDAHEFFAEGILVHNCEKCWADERASWKYDAAWDNLMMGMRLGQAPQCVVTTTPRATKAIKELCKLPTSRVIIGSTYENRDNLAPAFFAEVIRKYEGTRLGRQELLAEILEDVEGALWNQDMLDATRVLKAPELVRVVVGVDPAVTNNEGSDETGIVVAGLGVDGHFYVLADYTLKASPLEWAKRVVFAYNRWQADRVIGEVNNGGDLIEINIRQVDPNISYKSVHATRGKILRAEPIVALYEQNRAHHVGSLAKLEDEQTTWEQGKKSPGRIDAAVWALTELSEGSGSIPFASASGGAVSRDLITVTMHEVEDEEVMRRQEQVARFLQSLPIRRFGV